jgi:uncharacterized protein YciU (UPF0263 family)
MKTIISKLFPSLEIELFSIITENRDKSYTYTGKISNYDLKVSFQENSLDSASILLACLYNDDCEPREMKEMLDYMKDQIQLENNEELLNEIQLALKDDQIEIPMNFTMDIIVGQGVNVTDIPVLHE